MARLVTLYHIICYIGCIYAKFIMATWQLLFFVLAKKQQTPIHTLGALFLVVVVRVPVKLITISTWPYVQHLNNSDCSYYANASTH